MHLNGMKGHVREFSINKAKTPKTAKTKLFLLTFWDWIVAISETGIIRDQIVMALISLSSFSSQFLRHHFGQTPCSQLIKLMWLTWKLQWSVYQELDVGTIRSLSICQKCVLWLFVMDIHVIQSSEVAYKKGNFRAVKNANLLAWSSTLRKVFLILKPNDMHLERAVHGVPHFPVWLHLSGKSNLSLAVVAVSASVKPTLAVSLNLFHLIKTIPSKTKLQKLIKLRSITNLLILSCWWQLT